MRLLDDRRRRGGRGPRRERRHCSRCLLPCRDRVGRLPGRSVTAGAIPRVRASTPPPTLTRPRQDPRRYPGAEVTLPPGNVVTWRSQARQLVEELAARRDLRATLRVVVDELAAAYHPSSAMASPGHERLAAAIAAGTGRGSCDPSTVTRAMDRLTSWGLVHRVAAGTVVQGPGGDSTYLRAEYGLLLPAARAAPARTASGASTAATSPDPARGGSPRAAAVRWPMCEAPRTRAQRHAAAARLQAEAAGLRGCSPEALASTLREWFAAGWTPSDVLAAADSRPNQDGKNGGRWTFTTAPRHVGAWVRFRLAFWRAGDAPGRSPAQRRRATDQAAQHHHAVLAAALSAPCDVVVGEQLAAAAGQVREVLRAGGRRTRTRSADLPARRTFGARNADPSVSYLTGGESFTRTRERINDGTPNGVRTGLDQVREALRQARSADLGPPGRAGPSLRELHSQHVPRPWALGTV